MRLYQMYFASGILSIPNEISLCHDNAIIVIHKLRSKPIIKRYYGICFKVLVFAIHFNSLKYFLFIFHHKRNFATTRLVM